MSTFDVGVIPTPPFTPHVVAIGDVYMSNLVPSRLLIVLALFTDNGIDFAAILRVDDQGDIIGTQDSLIRNLEDRILVGSVNTDFNNEEFTITYV